MTEASASNAPKPLIPTTPSSQPYYMECVKCGHEVTALPSAKCPECSGRLSNAATT